MAKENPQASDENELEIGVEESEQERSDSSSSEEEEVESDDDTSDSESESETVTSVGSKRPNEEVNSDVRSKKSRVDGVEEDEWFEKSFLFKDITRGDFVSEFAVRRAWRRMPMEEKKIVKEKYMVFQKEAMRFACVKSEFMCEVASALAQVKFP